MFQNFELNVDPANGAARIRKLREAMQRAGVDAFHAIICVFHVTAHLIGHLTDHCEIMPCE